ncbi:putative bifunctional diguanylate cyclase/phosphodiesterase [Celerinatantimonas yamalensis]|uniref:Bifunctional diguanylate cyclase/phosphodiesterase n=1 Tax=Celerinatantimonas yamalensis TaxID=559956 RepID=A0ABW9G4X8_9GAMM
MGKSISLGVLHQTLFVLSGLLILIFSGLVALNYYNIRSFFEIERSETIQHEKKLFFQHYADVHQQLQLISRAKFAEQPVAKPFKNAELLWLQLQQSYHHPLLNMVVIDKNHHRLMSQGTRPVSDKILDWFENPRGNHHSKPWLLDCASHCEVYFKTRLSIVEQQYTVIYGLDAQRLYDSYIGDQPQNMLVGIQAHDRIALLYSSSKIDRSLGLLIDKMTRRALQQGLADLITPNGVVELISFRLSNTTSNIPIFFVQFHSINGLVAHFRQANRNNLLYGLGSLLIAVLMLMLLLRRPLLRIRWLTQCLPMLASSNYRQFRQAVAQQRQGRIVDESDQLGQAATQLSYQLERLERQLKSRADELEWLAGHDHLTQLPNRREFEKLINQQLESYIPGCLMLLDLDNFRYVNELSGHNTGDQMIQQVAQMLKRLLPENAIISRISGDQFGLFIQQADSILSKNMAQRLNKLIGEIRVPGHSAIHTASASIGVVLGPEHGNSYNSLMSKADICLFQAKSQGKHCSVFYQVDNQSGGDVVQLHYWLDLAQHAIERGQMVLHYQPIYDNRIQEIRHYEVLLRVRGDNQQLISPYELILAAEKNGYISDIDLWVIRCAFDQLEDNFRHHHRDRLAINLSARSFCSEHVIAQIAYEVEHRSLPGELIIFEITETAALPNLKMAQAHIQILKDLGCAISLDDFGVGYSSFHSLRELPLDYVKIDGSFVRDIIDNTKNRYFVRSLCRIAHDLGLLTVAEFVESSALYHELQGLGVDFSQGYYIGKPMPAEQIWSTQRSAQVLSLRPH